MAADGDSVERSGTRTVVLMLVVAFPIALMALVVAMGAIYVIGWVLVEILGGRSISDVI